MLLTETLKDAATRFGQANRDMSGKTISTVQNLILQNRCIQLEEIVSKINMSIVFPHNTVADLHQMDS